MVEADTVLVAQPARARAEEAPPRPADPAPAATVGSRRCSAERP